MFNAMVLIIAVAAAILIGSVLIGVVIGLISRVIIPPDND